MSDDVGGPLSFLCTTWHSEKIPLLPLVSLEPLDHRASTLSTVPQKRDVLYSKELEVALRIAVSTAVAGMRCMLKDEHVI